MDAEPGYDTTNLHALRRELTRLNEGAVKDGSMAPRDGWPEAPAPTPQARRPRTGSADKGKAGARRLLTMLARVEGDDSPSVSGTDFTEAGVVRLLAHLRRPRGRPPGGWLRFLQRLHRFLIRPVATGTHTIAGISVERLQLVSRQLLRIEADGWEHFQSIRAARRGGQAPWSQSSSPGPRQRPVAPAAPKATAPESQ